VRSFVTEMNSLMAMKVERSGPVSVFTANQGQTSFLKSKKVGGD
jgi:hypothetical protein